MDNSSLAKALLEKVMDSETNQCNAQCVNVESHSEYIDQSEILPSESYYELDRGALQQHMFWTNRNIHGHC